MVDQTGFHFGDLAWEADTGFTSTFVTSHRELPGRARPGRVPGTAVRPAREL